MVVGRCRDYATEDSTEYIKILCNLSWKIKFFKNLLIKMSELLISENPVYVENNAKIRQH